MAVPGRGAGGPEAGWELVSVVRDLAGARTVSEVVDVVRVAARRLTGADGATFVLRDGDRCRYVDEDAISPLWKGRAFAMDDCISGWAMRHRTAVSIDDIYADDRIPHDAYRPTFVRSLVMVPIRTAEPVGAIGAYWADAASPTTEDVAVLQALADSTAVAIENARLIDELEERVATRTAELAQANDDLRELAATVAHDIRSPLTSVIGFASALSTHYGDELGDGARVMLTALERNADGLHRFVNDLLDYLAAGTREPQLTTVDLDRLLADVVERIAGDIDARGAIVRRTGDGQLVGDPVLLGQAVQNLVANALVHTPADRAPVITVDVRRHAGWCELAVSDNGDGIPADDRGTLFEPFRRGAHARPGHGLGLAVCRRIAEQHDGEILVAENPDGGASFLLRLPDRGSEGSASPTA